MVCYYDALSPSSIHIVNPLHLESHILIRLFIYYSLFPHKISDTLQNRVDFMTSSTYLYQERSF